MSELSLHGVGVSLSGRMVVDGVDLSVGSGEWLGLVGPNGAGKTSLLRAITGQVPASGTIAVGSTDLAAVDSRARARLVSLVPQRPSLPPDMRVVDYVLLGRTAHLGYLARESDADLAAVARALASLDLDGFADRTLGALSGGEVQRVVLARALAQASPVLLLDEPTSALDVGAQQHVLDLVDGMRRSCGLTVVSAIHDLTLAARFSDRLVMMAGGSVVSEGSATTVLTESSIRRHYGARVRVLDDGEGGIVVIPLRDSAHLSRGATMSGP